MKLARKAALVASAIIVGACSSEPGSPADPGPDSGVPEAAPPEPPPEPAAITVGHEREVRGAWVSTVYNGTWPSKTGLAKDLAQTELLAILDALAAAHMNAVFLQVRPESDALYASTLEPWSRFLTGVQGKDPGWDPLAFAVAEGHARGLEVHAWVNPYRGMTSATVTTDAQHVTRMLPDRAYPYGSQVWMDPGAPEVRAHILDVVRDIVTRYDVDGLHFDDYFYPYPIASVAFPDDVTYAAYVDGGGGLARSDWRRSNVDGLVRDVAALVGKTRPDVRFGISPFGIYRPGTPPGITGLDAFAEIYCDPVKWMTEGWVDYVAPQLYWPTTRTAQAFGKLVTWWAGLAANGRSVLIGHDLSSVGEKDWPVSEISLQVKLSRDERPRGVRGNVFFTAGTLVSDKLGVRTELAKTFWSTPAATPPLASARGVTIAPPPVRLEARRVTMGTPLSTTVRAWAIHRRAGAAWVLAELVSPLAGKTERVLTLEPGDYAVSVIDRRGLESVGVPLHVR